MAKDYFAEFQKERNATLVKLGFDVTKMTEDQLYLITEPTDAPENFHCDGEVSPTQAWTMWEIRMKRAGLTPLQIFKAKKFNFG